MCFVPQPRASRHNCVQFFISHLARWLRTRRFSEPAFRPSGATNHWKNIVNRDLPTFSRTCLFFLLTLSLLWSSHSFCSPLWLFPPLLFHLSILSEVWLLNFLRWGLTQLDLAIPSPQYTTPVKNHDNYFSLDLTIGDLNVFKNIHANSLTWGGSIRLNIIV